MLKRMLTAGSAARRGARARCMATAGSAAPPPASPPLIDTPQHETQRPPDVTDANSWVAGQKRGMPPGGHTIATDAATARQMGVPEATIEARDHEPRLQPEEDASQGPQRGGRGGGGKGRGGSGSGGKGRGGSSSSGGGERA